MTRSQIQRFVRQNQLRPADAVIVKKRGLGILDHYVIYLGEYKGTPQFIANYTKGVKIIPLRELQNFLSTYAPVKLNRFVGSEQQRKEAIRRAYQRLDEDAYHLILNNCEHYARYVQEGNPRSNQVRNWGLGALGGLALLGLVWALSGNDDDEEYD